MDLYTAFQEACNLMENGTTYEDDFKADSIFEKIATILIEERNMNLDILRAAVLSKNTCSYAYEHLLSHANDDSLARSFINEIDKAINILDMIESQFDLSEEDRRDFSNLRGRFYEFKGIYLYKLHDASCDYPLHMARSFGSNRAKLYLVLHMNDTIEEKDEECYAKMVALLESYISNYSSVGEGCIEPATACEWLANYYEYGVGTEKDEAKAKHYRELHDNLIANREEEQMESWNRLCEMAPWVVKTN